MGECLDIISGSSEILPSNVSYKASSNDQYRFLYKSVNMDVGVIKSTETKVWRVPCDKFQIRSSNQRCLGMSG